MSGRKHRILPPVWLLITLLMQYLAHRLVPLAELFSAPWNYSGLVLMAFGLFMSATAANLFKRADTPVIPFEKSTALVTNGWFRYTRNPMYLGMVLGCVGLAILLGSLGAWLPLPEFILILRVRFIRGEEALLEDTFGEEYLRYKSKVRRWL